MKDSLPFNEKQDLLPQSTAAICRALGQVMKDSPYNNGIKYFVLKLLLPMPY